MLEILAGATSITSAIELAKTIRSSVNSVADSETKMQIAELISTLADTKLERAEHLSHIQELEQRLSLKENMRFKASCYWIDKGDDGEDGPFCTRCFDVDLNAVRLRVGGIYSECPECKNKYTDNIQNDNYAEAKKARIKNNKERASKWGNRPERS